MNEEIQKLKEEEKDNACEEHKGNWHLQCPKCYSNYCKMIDKLAEKQSEQADVIKELGEMK